MHRFNDCTGNLRKGGGHHGKKERKKRDKRKSQEKSQKERKKGREKEIEVVSRGQKLQGQFGLFGWIAFFLVK